MKKHIFSLLAILLVNCLSICMQAADEYTLLKIDANKGLSHSAVLSMYQDHWGTMWLGTYDGLDNYDGRTMEVYREDKGTDDNQLLNNVIYQVNGADEDCLWISTNKGVNRFSLKKRCVIDSYEIFSGAFWLASNRKGSTWVYDQKDIYWYDARTREFRKVHQAERHFSKELAFVDDKDCLWLFSAEDSHVYRYHIDLQKDSLPTCAVMRANIHPKRIRYASYQNGILSMVDEDMDLFLQDVERNTKVYIRNIADLVKQYGDIKGIISFYDDVVIAFVQNGLLRLEAANYYKESFIDRNLRIFSVYKDPVQNTIWVGTDGQGVAVYSKKRSMAVQLMYKQMMGRITRQVRSIYTDSLGNLWFGTKGDGLVRIERYADQHPEELDYSRFSVYSPGSKKPLMHYERGGMEFQVFGIIPSRFGKRLWVGSAEHPGLTYYDYQRDAVIPLGGDTDLLERVHWVYEENDSTLWMTTSGNGLCKTILATEKDGTLVARRTRQFVFQAEDGRDINDFFPMCEDGDSLLWLGSRGKGLVKFNLHTEAYTIYQPNKESKRSTNDILSIYRKDNVFYLGTVSGLVQMTLDQQGKAEYLCMGREQGFLNDMIHGVLEDEEGFLWLSTNKGLVKYNPGNQVFHTYYYSNGLQIGEFSDDAFHKCAYTGRLFFGGIDGLLYLEKGSTNEAEYYLDICFRQLTLGGEPVNFYDYYNEDTRTLTLNGTSASFSLSFVAPDFVYGDNFEYSYKLEGAENSDWSPFSSESVVSFRKLPPGHYTLKVQYKKDAFDNDYPSYSLHIHVVAPWFLSTLAYLIYLLIGVALIAYVVWLVRNYYVREKLFKELMKHEAGVSWEVNMALDGYLPEKNPEKGIVNVKETSTRILSKLLEETQDDAASVQVSLDEELSVVLPACALEYMLHFLYVDALRKRMNARLSGTMEGKCLVLLWEVPEAYAAKLQAMNGESLLSEGLQHDFNACLHWWLYVYALKTMKVSLVLDEKGKGIYFRFPAQVAKETTSVQVPDRKKVLLLENRMEIAWLVENMLSDTYTVQCVHTVKDAFDYLRQELPDVFLADALIYGKEEQKFMEYVQANRGVLTRTAFVLMLTWKAADLLHRQFRNLVDGFVVMPFSILFLRDIVEMAVRRVSKDDNGVLKHLSDSAEKEQEYDSSSHTDFMKRLTTIVEENLGAEDLSASFLADRMFMSSRQFYRRFKDINGCSPTDFIKNYRLDKAARLLRDSNLSVMEVVSEVGIVSRSYFYKEFYYKFGVTPKEYRELKTKPHDGVADSAANTDAADGVNLVDAANERNTHVDEEV